MSAQENIIREQLLCEYPLEAVWRYLVTENGLQRWLNARRLVLEIADHGRLQLDWRRDGRLVTVVGETSFINPPRQLIITWVERDETGVEWLFPTIVSIEFASVIGGTMISVTHKGFERQAEEIRDYLVRAYQWYWENQMQRALPETMGGVSVMES